MTRCVCLVQEGQTPDERKTILGGLLNTYSERAFGEGADINWVTVPAGSGFTAAQPSTSSIVSFTAPQAVEQGVRTSLLTDLCDLWMDETGCSLDEIVAVINDPRD